MKMKLRDNVEVAAVVQACRAGYHDPCLDFSSGQKRPHVTLRLLRYLPDGATHHFSIQIDDLCYRATRYADRWTIVKDDKTEVQRRERALRENALAAALRHFAKEQNHPLEKGGEDTFVNKLLNEGMSPSFLEISTSVTGHHPIVREESSKDERRWSVQVGSYRCLVGLAQDTPEPAFIIL